jgi:hypothetical protein
VTPGPAGAARPPGQAVRSDAFNGVADQALSRL